MYSLTEVDLPPVSPLALATMALIAAPIPSNVEDACE